MGRQDKLSAQVEDLTLGYRQVATISERGDAPGQFSKSLRGVALDASDRLYAVGDSHVQVFEPDGSLAATWRTELKPFCVAVAPSGRVLVGEAGQVEHFDSAGELLTVWKDAPRMGRVTAIVPLDDRVLLADATARCLRSYSTNGKHQRDIGHDGRMKGFLIPNGVLDFSVDSEGTIHAANPGKHRVERYSLDGELLGHFGRFDGRDPAGFSGCCNPTNVTVHGEHIYVTEKADPRAKVYDREGGLLAVIASDEFDPLCKNMDLVVDSKGRVFVIDTAQLCVRVFARDETGEEDR